MTTDDLTEDQRQRLSQYLHDESERTAETPASIFARISQDPSALASACAYQSQQHTAQPE